MKWHLLGIGAIGGLWAASLARAGFLPTLILRDDKALEQFNREPLCLESGVNSYHPEVEVATPATLSAPVEWLLVTTKSYATLHALTSIESWVAPHCRIILLQNGMGMPEQVVMRYPGRTIIAGVSTDAVWRRGRFHVVLAALGKTLFGTVYGVDHEAAQGLASCFAELELDARWVEDIATPAWHKVAVNASVNALTALAGCRNGELLEDPESLAMMRKLAAEIEQVMVHAGIPVSGSVFDQACHVLTATADNYSSMYQDVKQRRQTEIDVINGFICREGKRLGVDTPVNQHLLDRISALDSAGCNLIRNKPC